VSGQETTVQSHSEPLDDGEIAVTELAARIERGERLQIVDVREAYEHAFARIEGGRLIPLRTLPARSAELDREAETVVYCHHGARSAQAVEYLRRLGFREARNLAGGIDRWSVEVDPAVPRY
jgi:adenylyltransferase/sulfurtransferase